MYRGDFSTLESGRAFQMNYTNLGNFPDTRKAEKIKRLIEKHHGLISREEIANILNYSPNYVYHIFQKVMKRSVQDYCQEVQVRTFASKLENTELSIDQICKECGQKNKTQFYKIFKRFYHMTPKEYREYIKKCRFRNSADNWKDLTGDLSTQFLWLSRTTASMPFSLAMAVMPSRSIFP